MPAPPASGDAPPPSPPNRGATARRTLRPLTALLGGAFLAAAAWVGLSDPGPQTLDLSEGDSALLAVDEGRREEGSLVVRLVDPRWGRLSESERTASVRRLFDRLRARGIRVLTLVDGEKRQVARATEEGDAVRVELPGAAAPSR